MGLGPEDDQEPEGQNGNEPHPVAGMRDERAAPHPPTVARGAIRSSTCPIGLHRAVSTACTRRTDASHRKLEIGCRLASVSSCARTRQRTRPLRARRPTWRPSVTGMSTRSRHLSTNTGRRCSASRDGRRPAPSRMRSSRSVARCPRRDRPVRGPLVAPGVDLSDRREHRQDEGRAGNTKHPVLVHTGSDGNGDEALSPRNGSSAPAVTLVTGHRAEQVVRASRRRSSSAARR